MFNALEYRAANERQCALVLSGDQAWRATIATRWAGFMAARIAAATKSLDTLDGRAGDPGVNPAKVRTYVAGMRARAKAMLADAEAIGGGRKPLPDPVGAEATLRLYEAAAVPKRAA